jgi:hypothetical protein
MHTQTAKQQALDTIAHLPDNVDLDEIVYRLYVLNKIRQGLRDIEENRGIASEVLRQEIEQW